MAAVRRAAPQDRRSPAPATVAGLPQRYGPTPRGPSGRTPGENRDACQQAGSEGSRRGRGIAIPRVCTVCSHDLRREIDVAIVHGGGNRRIATRYGLSEAAVRRHRASHIPELLLKAYEASDLLADIARLRASAFDLLGKA